MVDKYYEVYLIEPKDDKMTNRKPHWDDKLLNAVGDLIYTDRVGNDLVYALIAAVEKWQEESDLCSGCISAMGVHETIQRVRELHVANVLGACRECWHEYPCATIRRILDGERDD